MLLMIVFYGFQIYLYYCFIVFIFSFYVIPYIRTEKADLVSAFFI